MADRKMRILVVDDANLVRLYYRQILEEAGFEVEEALNGIEALERLLVSPPDALIVDINMPLMDGVTFLGALRRQALPLSSIPTLVTSTESKAADIEAARVAGANFYSAKPVGREAWLLDDVAGHWDQLQLRAYATIDGRRVSYQEGTLAGMRTPTDLIARYGKALAPDTVMFCGTLAAIGGIRPASRFEIELTDPVLNRTLKHAYDIDILPVVA